MVLLPVKQYYLQTDSATRHGDRMCFSTTCAMAVKYLQPDALRGSNADDDYLKTVLKYGDTTQYTSHIKACADYGVLATFYRNGSRTNLQNELKAGFPVATGILHHGPVTSPRGGGHWMLLIGDDGVKGIFHDPYGELDNVNGGYVTIGSGGKGVKYSWKNWLRRWEIEGPRTGWYMTFRPNKKDIEVPAKPTSNTWEGVQAAAKTAGAKFPQVVAAQWALESGWGKHTSGKNNYFGLKGVPGQGALVRTTEFIAGVEQKVDAWFKDYPSLQDCVTDLVNKWYKDYKGYKGINRAATADECANLLIQEGYATDPKYATKLINIMNRKDD
jgi:hypothetical protein